jgi:hypothetical protein
VAGDVAWLAYGGTLPEHRRRGSLNLLLATRIDEAFRRGVRTVAAAAVLPPDGRATTAYRNILRRGMELVYKGTDFIVDAVEP